jgi:hypothetical protein
MEHFEKDVQTVMEVERFVDGRTPQMEPQPIDRMIFVGMLIFVMIVVDISS